MIVVKNKGSDNFMGNFVLPAQSPKVVVFFSENANYILPCL
jgi:hypothetical protein